MELDWFQELFSFTLEQLLLFILTQNKTKKFLHWDGWLDFYYMPQSNSVPLYWFGCPLLQHKLKNIKRQWNVKWTYCWKQDLHTTEFLIFFFLSRLLKICYNGSGKDSEISAQCTVLNFCSSDIWLIYILLLDFALTSTFIMWPLFWMASKVLYTIATSTPLPQLQASWLLC